MKGRGKQMADCPLTFPDFPLVDHVQHCPRYTQLTRTDVSASTLNVDELTALKDDLDLLHASVTERISTLIQEREALINWSSEANKKDKPLSEEGESSESRSTRNTPTVSDKSGGRSLRDTPTRSETNSPAPSRSKHKHDKQTKPPGAEALGRPPKSDAPEKFWTIVEPYCADISQDDMKSLEELMKSHDDDMEYYKIPSLGKHYSHKWLHDDTDVERKDGLKLSDKKKLLSAGQKRRLDNGGETSYSSMDETSSNKTNTDPTTCNTTDNSPSSDSDQCEFKEESPFGPLTQRLVSALLEENVMSAADEETVLNIGSTTSATSEDNSNTTSGSGGAKLDESISEISPSALAKQLNINYTATLEKRIRRELEEQGILKPDDALDGEEDEILAELKQKQQELRAIGQHNLNMTKRLYRMGKEEMGRQDLRRKLAAVDADVTEAYKKVLAARQKKRPPTKREKDYVMKALKERETLVKQIEASGHWE